MGYFSPARLLRQLPKLVSALWEAVSRQGGYAVEGALGQVRLGVQRWLLQKLLVLFYSVWDGLALQKLCHNRPMNIADKASIA